MILAIIVIRKINNISVNKPSDNRRIYKKEFYNLPIKHPKRFVANYKNIKPINNNISYEDNDKIDIKPKMQRNPTIITKMMTQLNDSYKEN